MNEKYGYEEVNKRIREKLDKLKYPDYILGRWFSGDELVIISVEDFTIPFVENVYKLSVTGEPTFRYWGFFGQESMDKLRENISKSSMGKEYA